MLAVVLNYAIAEHGGALLEEKIHIYHLLFADALTRPLVPAEMCDADRISNIGVHY